MGKLQRWYSARQQRTYKRVWELMDLSQRQSVLDHVMRKYILAGYTSKEITDSLVRLCKEQGWDTRGLDLWGRESRG